MKVIFVKNVPKVGKIGEIKDMPDGYVRNFLLPKGFAIIATPQAISKLEQSRNEIKVDKEVQLSLFKKNLEAINDSEIIITAVSNEKGHLFQAIHAKDIITAIKKQCKVVLDEEYIKLKEPLKQIGTFLVVVEALGMTESIKVTIAKK